MFNIFWPVWLPISFLIALGLSMALWENRFLRRLPLGSMTVIAVLLLTAMPTIAKIACATE